VVDPDDKTVTLDGNPWDAPEDEPLPFEEQHGTTDVVGPVDCLALNRLHTAPPTLGTLLCRGGGASKLVVIAKAAFSMESTPMDPAAAPPLHLQDAHYRNRPMARVVAPSDMVPGRSRVDVTLDGTARAPAGDPITEMAVRLTVRQDGEAVIDKPLLVVASEGEDGPIPFSSMPIAYERAPIGRAPFVTPIGLMDDDAAPNVIDPNDPERAAGYGPIGESWPSRRKLLRPEHKAILNEPVMDVPDDFDWRYFQAAPLDQQIDHLAPNAAITIVGFHPDELRVAAQLPDAEAVGVIFGLDASNPKRPTPLSFRADSLHIHADKRRCVVTWRAVIEVPSEAIAPSLLVAAGVTTTRGTITLPNSPPNVPRRKNKPIVLPEPEAPAPGQTVNVDSWRSVQPGKTLPFDSSRTPDPPADDES
jgi:hypothetical protein